MHFHFPFTTLQVLWTLTFAAHLVLLIVLMGRDRVRLFPWFTANIVLVAFRLLTSRLLFGRLPQMTMAEMFIVMADLGAFLGLMVVLELARRAFGGVGRPKWLLGALFALVVGVVVLVYWGAWPAWNTLVSAPPMQFAQLAAQKGLQLVDVENIVVGLLIVFFGSRTGAGFRSKTQQIAVGLMTASIAQLSIQAIWEQMARTAVAHTRPEYEHIIGIRDRLFNTNNAVYIAVLIWWIVCLWIDEPGTVRPGEVASGTVENSAAMDRVQPEQRGEPAEHGVVPGRELPRGPDVDPLLPPGEHRPVEDTPEERA